MTHHPNSIETFLLVPDEYDRFLRRQDSALSHVPTLDGSRISTHGISVSSISSAATPFTSTVAEFARATVAGSRESSAPTNGMRFQQPNRHQISVTPSIMAAPVDLLDAFRQSIVRYPLYTLGVLTTDIDVTGGVISVRWATQSQVRLKITSGRPFASGAMRDARICHVDENVGVPFLDERKTYIVKTHKDDLLDLFVSNYSSRETAVESLVDKVMCIAQ